MPKSKPSKNLKGPVLPKPTGLITTAIRDISLLKKQDRPLVEYLIRFLGRRSPGCPASLNELAVWAGEWDQTPPPRTTRVLTWLVEAGIVFNFFGQGYKLTEEGRTLAELLE